MAVLSTELLFSSWVGNYDGSTIKLNTTAWFDLALFLTGVWIPPTPELCVIAKHLYLRLKDRQIYRTCHRDTVCSFVSRPAGDLATVLGRVSGNLMFWPRVRTTPIPKSIQCKRRSVQFCSAKMIDSGYCSMLVAWTEDRSSDRCSCLAKIALPQRSITTADNGARENRVM